MSGSRGGLRLRRGGYDLGNQNSEKGKGEEERRDGKEMGSCRFDVNNRRASKRDSQLRKAGMVPFWVPVSLKKYSIYWHGCLCTMRFPGCGRVD